MPSVRDPLKFFLVYLLPAVVGALAHGDETSHQGGHAAMDMSSSHDAGPICSQPRPMVMKDMEDFPYHESYFLHTGYSSLMSGHIVVMTLAWVVLLPLVVMLSMGRSRLSLPTQVAFLVLNAIGNVLSMTYRTHVPDLYENNSHHKLGWAMTWIVGVWTIMGIAQLYTRGQAAKGKVSTPPTSRRGITTPRQRQSFYDSVDTGRWSEDSSHETSPDLNPLCHSRSNSWKSSSTCVPTSPGEAVGDEDESLLKEEKQNLSETPKIERSFSGEATRLLIRGSRIIGVFYTIVERGLLPLAFVSFLTGIVAYSGIAREVHVFNILAHLIKGGIFFWYGLLTFGRWMGCFSDLGWAWNMKPGAEVVGLRKSKLPSAEFTESFVIFFYGASNVFLEHLGAWGEEWTAMDLEHVSITIMFFGGGLLGMLIESPKVRSFLSISMSLGVSHSQISSPDSPRPRSYVHSLNPIPSLVILLLGIMMSNHTQHSMISGQVHRQWGLLFAGFALARSLTYMTFWLKPPRTNLPTRPPTELLASFCLISGGAIFMASNKDTINALEEYHLDSMFVFTIMMGLTFLTMAWMLFAVAVKGWAARKHQAEVRSVHPTSPV